MILLIPSHHSGQELLNVQKELLRMQLVVVRVKALFSNIAVW